MDFESLIKKKDVKSEQLPETEAVVVKEGTITLPEIIELEEPIKNIIEQIRVRIENGEYGLIISDDVSGRIPALILGGFIKRISELKKVCNPNLLFIPGNLDSSQYIPMRQTLIEYLEKHGIKKGERILIITEVLHSGVSLKVLTRLLKEFNFGVDIATMGIDVRKGVLGNLEREKNLRDVEIVSGDYMRENSTQVSYVPLIYKRKERTGVYKNPGELVSKPLRSKYKDNVFGTALEKRAKNQKKINNSRAEVKILVEKLVKWYLSQEEEKKLKVE
ncbi:MAG: hypothetical protein V4699_01310 [Patescibacteria group bacterium]